MSSGFVCFNSCVCWGFWLYADPTPDIAAPGSTLVQRTLIEARTEVWG